MELKTTIALFVIAIAAFGMIAASTITDSHEASAKECNPHGCKGTHGYYTENGHHHCYKGSSGCYKK
ncbi:MAG: hypothetical protein ABJB76_05755 [Candidatus Nitrosocosmicus sp.]